MLENIPQHLVRGDFAEDGAEVVEGLAGVFGEEVGSLAGGEERLTFSRDSDAFIRAW